MAHNSPYFPISSQIQKFVIILGQVVRQKWSHTHHMWKRCHISQSYHWYVMILPIKKQRNWSVKTPLNLFVPHDMVVSIDGILPQWLVFLMGPLPIYKWMFGGYPYFRNPPQNISECCHGFSHVNPWQLRMLVGSLSWWCRRVRLRVVVVLRRWRGGMVEHGDWFADWAKNCLFFFSMVKT